MHPEANGGERWINVYRVWKSFQYEFLLRLDALLLGIDLVLSILSNFLFFIHLSATELIA